jgi:hypothetical protein
MAFRRRGWDRSQALSVPMTGQARPFWINRTLTIYLFKVGTILHSLLYKSVITKDFKSNKFVKVDSKGLTD